MFYNFNNEKIINLLTVRAITKITQNFKPALLITYATGENSYVYYTSEALRDQEYARCYGSTQK